MRRKYLELVDKSAKLPLPTDVTEFTLYCEYLVHSYDPSVTLTRLNNLNDYIKQLDPTTFSGTRAKIMRYQFMELFLNARLDQNITSVDACLIFVVNSTDDDDRPYMIREVIGSAKAKKLTKADLTFISDLVYAQLNAMFLYGYREAFIALLDDMSDGEYGKDVKECDDLYELFQRIVATLGEVKRKSKNSKSFNLTDELGFKSFLDEAIDRATSPTNFHKTGWIGLNKMLNGGFEDGRVYNVVGATGGFKSGLLLNIMKQIKLYNKGRPHKQPNARPTILFLSQENSIWETFMRIYGIFGSTDSIKRKTAKEIIDSLAAGGFRLVSDEDDIDIEFRYYGNMEIGVSDIRGIVTEMEGEGREVVFIIQDYIERLRPPSKSVDKRLQLADVSNELHDLAVELEIPIVTASQFNRDAIDKIEQARLKGKIDLSKLAGSSNVSESFGMLKNFDVTFSIIVEYDSREERFYLAFRMLKFRGDDTDALTYFLQPFSGKNSKIQLMDDIGTGPLYRLNMVEEFIAGALYNQDDGTGISTMRKTSLPDMDTDDEAIANFMVSHVDDIHKSPVDQADDTIRDDEGFMVLSYTEHGQKMIDFYRNRAKARMANSI